MLATILAFLEAHDVLIGVVVLLAAQKYLHTTSLAAITELVKAALPPGDKAIEAAIEAAVTPKPTAPKVPPLPVIMLVLGVLAGAMMLGSQSGCTKAQQQTAKTVVQDVDVALTDVQRACVIAQVFAGVVDPAAAPAIALACGIDAAAEKALEAEMAIAQASIKQLTAIELAKPGSKPAVCR